MKKRLLPLLLAVLILCSVFAAAPLRAYALEAGPTPRCILDDGDCVKPK